MTDGGAGGAEHCESDQQKIGGGRAEFVKHGARCWLKEPAPTIGILPEGQNWPSRYKLISGLYTLDVIKFFRKINKNKAW